MVWPKVVTMEDLRRVHVCKRWGFRRFYVHPKVVVQSVGPLRIVRWLDRG